MPDMQRMPTAMKSNKVSSKKQGRKAVKGGPKMPAKPPAGSDGQVPCKKW